jgi:hypothetical protein
MIWKLGALSGAAMAGVWASGMLDHSYARTVARSSGEVTQALAQLDIAQAPGAPETDPARAGGDPPMFRMSRAGNELVWTVMSGDKVATRMIADVVAIDATHARVVARIERGDAPDDFVSPAFRSHGITMALFGMALEDQLNRLTAPPENVAGCAALMRRFRNGAFASPPDDRIGQAGPGVMGQVAKTALALNAIEGERRRLGCKDQAPRTFRSFRRLTRTVDDAPVWRSDGVRIVPGEPMVDPDAAANPRRYGYPYRVGGTGVPPIVNVRPDAQ